MVQVEAILFASLAASLLSAFLAMLGKQWLNQYASTDMRGTAIERSQNRQRKLDGVVVWCFDHVMDSLPLMLQIALLLLGCALSRYLWEINTTVASVVLGVTSFGVVFYVLIVIAGTASESCPYQTPGAHILRYILRHILPRILPALLSSRCFYTLSECWSSFRRPWYSLGNILVPIGLSPYIPVAVAIDAYHLGRATLRLLVAFVRMVYRWGVDATPRSHTLDQQTTTLGLRCVSWMLQMSLDKAVRLSAMKYLATMTTLVEFNPIIVADCFNVFISCINIRNYEAVIMHGSEQLATVSAMCFLRTFYHLSVADPTSGVLEEVRRRYNRHFSSAPDFGGLPLCYMMAKIHNLAGHWELHLPCVPWGDYGPFTQGHIPVARSMAEGARVEYQQTKHRKVPRWILNFALHSLSLDPLPPTPVVADCLSIVAIDLDCGVSDTRFAIEDERCVHIF